MLSKEELNRYNRHLILPNFGEKEQEKLKSSKVLIVGVGGLGSAISLYLTAAGVGTIGLIDDDHVSISNLQRQILYCTDEAGESKSKLAKKKLKALNPSVNINQYHDRLNEDNILSIIGEYEIIIDGTDNFDTRYLIDDACSYLKKPFIYGSINEFSGQASVFNYNNGPTYRCLYPERDRSNDEKVIGVIGALPGIIGSIQAMEAIKILAGIGEPLSGSVFLIDTLTMQSNIIILKANSENQKGRFNRFYD